MLQDILGKDRALSLFMLVDTSWWWLRPEVMNPFMAGSCELAEHLSSGDRKRFRLFELWVQLFVIDTVREGCFILMWTRVVMPLSCLIKTDITSV